MLYDAVPATELGEAGDALRQAALDGVLLYSPRTARIWRGLIEKASLQPQAARIYHFCLSRNVAAVLPETWTTQVAERPEEGAMLALLEQTRRTL